MSETKPGSPGKRPYEQPSVKLLGTVKDLTQGSAIKNGDQGGGGKRNFSF